MKQHPKCKACGKPMRRSHQNLGNFHGQKCAAAWAERVASSRILSALAQLTPADRARENRARGEGGSMMHSETVSLTCPNGCDPDYVGVHLRVQGYSRADVEAEYESKECSCADFTSAQIERLEQTALDRALDPS